MAGKNVSKRAATLQLNASKPTTFGGGTGYIEADVSKRLLRQVATCMLWEPTFYQSGDEIASSLATDALNSPLEIVAKYAIMARDEFKLRSVPLFLVALMDQKRAENTRLVSETAYAVIQRADQMAELLALIAYVNGIQPSQLKGHISNAIKRGVKASFEKFNEYQLAKYQSKDKAITLRDVMFLVHPKPPKGMEGVYKSIAEGTLESADTWEVALSSGADKKETWERLIQENKLGDLALLRNLRNMQQAKVEKELIALALDRAKFTKVLPFRFISAARYAPSLEPELDKAMLKCVNTLDRLPGKTGYLIDVSGSMDYQLSSKSDLTRIDAASALAILLREISDDVVIATYSTNLVEVPPRRGMALRDAIEKSQMHGSTRTYQSVSTLSTLSHWKDCDRFILITDEQATDNLWNKTTLPPVGKRNYTINVAPYNVGLDSTKNYTTISGFSERIVDFIRWEEENE